jgi:hypothetical protein
MREKQNQLKINLQSGACVLLWETMKLLTTSNAKIMKGEKEGWMTVGIHLAPSNLSGYNVCSWASRGCSMACLNTSGHGAFSTVQAARIAKTKLLKENFDLFSKQLIKEIQAAIKKAKKNGMRLAIRLNLTSDIPWELLDVQDGKTIFELFPDVTWYDYTKGYKRMMDFLDGKMPKNYSLTFSRSESNERHVHAIRARGGNVAVVFRRSLPESWHGTPVVNGDKNDLRFLDARGVVVGLVEKGKAKKDDSGFVVQV